LKNLSIESLSSAGNNIFAGTALGGVFHSTDQGNSWTSASDGLWASTVPSLVSVGPNTFAGTSGGGIFLTSDSGSTWNATNQGLNSLYVWALLANGGNLFAGTDSGAFISTNNGASWSAINAGLEKTRINCLAISGSYLCAGSSGKGIYVSSDNGSHWMNASTGTIVMSLATIDSIFIAGDFMGRAFISYDHGSNWSQISTGLPNDYITSLCINSSYLFAGTEANGVWKRSLSEILTKVKTNMPELPNKYSLQQNFPNPFNPTTNISFDIPSQSFVFLKIFDIIGREVSTLVSEELPAGHYSRQWSAINFPSGVYFYRLQAGNYVEVKKLILLK